MKSGYHEESLTEGPGKYRQETANTALTKHAKKKFAVAECDYPFELVVKNEVYPQKHDTFDG
jgi:hypothetical protein